jgi:hypothetical protein
MFTSLRFLNVIFIFLEELARAERKKARKKKRKVDREKKDKKKGNIFLLMTSRLYSRRSSRLEYIRECLSLGQPRGE